MRFTHSARFDKDNDVNSETVLAAFVRGMAIQCHRNHELIDIVIPIVMKSIGVLHESDISAIFFQIKHRLTVCPVFISSFLDLKSQTFYPEICSSPRPSITLEMFFRCQRTGIQCYTEKQSRESTNLLYRRKRTRRLSGYFYHGSALL